MMGTSQTGMEHASAYVLRDLAGVLVKLCPPAVIKSVEELYISVIDTVEELYQPQAIQETIQQIWTAPTLSWYDFPTWCEITWQAYLWR